MYIIGRLRLEGDYCISAGGKVVDLKNKIEFEDEVYTTTGFCKKFMPDEKRNSKGAYQGPKYFTFKGALLTDLRAKFGK